MKSFTPKRLSKVVQVKKSGRFEKEEIKIAGIHFSGEKGTLHLIAEPIDEFYLRMDRAKCCFNLELNDLQKSFVSNASIRDIITAIEIYFKDKFVEILKKRGVKDEKIVKSDRPKKIGEDVFSYLERTKIINFQDFDEVKKAYKRCLGISLDDVLDSDEENAIHTTTLARHLKTHTKSDIEKPVPLNEITGEITKINVAVEKINRHIDSMI